MELLGYYYLHTNGQLIFKSNLNGVEADIRESDFAECMWPIYYGDREGAWNILVEALALDADKTRVYELATKWNCDDEDANNYANSIGVILGTDGDQQTAVDGDFTCLAEHNAGFGNTKLEAIADLAKQIGVSKGKMWRRTFTEKMKAALAKELM